MNALLALLAVTVESLALALSHVSTGLNYYRSGQHDRALYEFNIVLRDYADTPAADDALYWSAQALNDSGRKLEAEKKLTELAERFPRSPYLTEAGVARVAEPVAAPPPVPKPVTPSVSPVAVPAPTSTKPHAMVAVKKVGDQTVVTWNDKTFSTATEFAAALADAKKAQPDVEVTFRRGNDVDLQMVVDAINALDQAGIAYKLP